MNYLYYVDHHGKEIRVGATEWTATPVGQLVFIVEGNNPVLIVAPGFWQSAGSKAK